MEIASRNRRIRVRTGARVSSAGIPIAHATPTPGTLGSVSFPPVCDKSGAIPAGPIRVRRSERWRIHRYGRIGQTPWSSLPAGLPIAEFGAAIPIQSPSLRRRCAALTVTLKVILAALDSNLSTDCRSLMRLAGNVAGYDFHRVAIDAPPRCGHNSHRHDRQPQQIRPGVGAGGPL